MSKVIDECTPEVDILASLGKTKIPEHLHGGLSRYIRDGEIPGSFLQAILCNHLRQACAVADADMNMGHLKALTRWLQEHAPLESFGSFEKMLAWSNERHAERLKEKQ